VTPNRLEARRLTDTTTVEAAVERLLHWGASAVLVTGADETSTGPVVNLLCTRHMRCEYRWPLLPGRHHGSGCTLASAAGARLAAGDSTVAAVTRAQRLTWDSLRASQRLGRGQLFPLRLPL
jgi:hydroxymethylpyrimidine/phosphomethylpyrimidine kinase